MSSKIVVIVLVGAAIFAWTQQDALKKQWQKYVKNEPSTTKTELYTWKDADGIVHFSATPDHKNAKLSTVDTSKITRLEPLPEPKQAQEDKLLLLKVRDELEANRNKMQEEKERRLMQQ